MALFASRIFCKVPADVSRKPYPMSKAKDTFYNKLGTSYAFPLFSLICKVLKKVGQEKMDMILITPVGQI